MTEFRCLSEVEAAAVGGARSFDIPVFPCPIAPEPKPMPEPTICPPPPVLDFDLLF